MAKDTRKFNGRTYTLAYRQRRKTDAKAIASGARQAGGRARVIPKKVYGKRYYYVYTRK